MADVAYPIWKDGVSLKSRSVPTSNKPSFLLSVAIAFFRVFPMILFNWWYGIFLYASDCKGAVKVERAFSFAKGSRARMLGMIKKNNNITFAEI